MRRAWGRGREWGSHRPGRPRRARVGHAAPQALASAKPVTPPTLASCRPAKGRKEGEWASERGGDRVGRRPRHPHVAAAWPPRFWAVGNPAHPPRPLPAPGRGPGRRTWRRPAAWSPGWTFRPSQRRPGRGRPGPAPQRRRRSRWRASCHQGGRGRVFWRGGGADGRAFWHRGGKGPPYSSEGGLGGGGGPTARPSRRPDRGLPRRRPPLPRGPHAPRPHATPALAEGRLRHSQGGVVGARR